MQLLSFPYLSHFQYPYLNFLQHFNDLLDSSLRVPNGDLVLDAEQLHELVLEDEEVEEVVVEGVERGEGLYELQAVLPLPVQDELPQEHDVVGEVAVDDAALPLEADLADGHGAVLEELADQLDHVLLPEHQVGPPQPRHHHPVTQGHSEG